MKKVKSIKGLEKEFDAVKSVVSGDTKFIAEALMFLSYRLDGYISVEKRLQKLLFDVETRFGSEMNPKELFEKSFPEVNF